MEEFFMDIFTHFPRKGKWSAFLCLWILLCGLVFPVRGNDEEANQAFLKGRELEKAGKYHDAARCYKDARILADSPAIKGNSLIAAARNFRKEELYGEEFNCLELLIREHLSGIDFTKVVEREFAIGDLYFRGHRDTPVKWLPFLQKDDRTIEVYEAALTHAPCAARAPEARLRLARLYIDKQNVKKAMHHLAETGKLYPGTRSAHDATLELASILFQLAKNGDGDNAYSRRTLEVLDEFEKKYPASPQLFWVKKHRQKVLDFVAERLDAIGSYYESIGRKETARQYFAEVVKNYSDTRQAAESEKKLAALEKEYVIQEGKGEYSPYKYPAVKQKEMDVWMPVMAAPDKNSNQWFFPVRDLNKTEIFRPGDLDKVRKEKTFENEKLEKETSK